MENRKIFGNRPTVVKKSDVLTALGDALLKIKCADRLTLEDMGVVLGRDKDSVSLYIAGETEMGVFAYHRARSAWGERFTGEADALIPAAEGVVE